MIVVYSWVCPRAEFRAVRWPMLLNLRTIRGARAHEHFSRVYEPAAFDASQDEFTVVGPVDLTFDLDKDGVHYRLVGRTTATIELKCSRCLEPFRIPVDAAFDLRYLPQPGQAEAGAGAEEVEVELGADDLTSAFYEEETIDLGQLMREQFYLALPMKPLCSEACRGLCPVCGTNLNRSTCTCRPVWEDPRLAALRAIKKDDDA